MHYSGAGLGSGEAWAINPKTGKPTIDDQGNPVISSRRYWHTTRRNSRYNNKYNTML